MAHATYPYVFPDENSGQWKCEMRDRKDGRVWGYGYGNCRNDAIKNARSDQPKDPAIKKAIGWVKHHPFIAGAVVGCYLSYRHAKNHQVDMRLGDYLVVGAIAGTIVWLVGKVVTWIANA
ncbi:MAG: hypothetical protein WCP18_03790 [bacterium]